MIDAESRNEPDAMSTYKIAEDVLFQELDGEAVLLSLEEGCYYGLDELGTRIWKLIDENLDPEQVVEKIVEEYDVDAEKARKDVDSFIRELEESGLIKQ